MGISFVGLPFLFNFVKMKTVKNKNQGKKMLRKNFLYGVALVFAAVIVCSIFLKFFTHHNEELAVPDFTTMTMADATALAKKSNLRLDVVDSVFINRLERGVVYRQNPQAGDAVKKNRRILITINSNVPQMTIMPNVVGYSLRQASAELKSRGLFLGKLIYQNDIATNNVLSQQINGQKISSGSSIETETAIDLVLGLNPEDSKTYVPYVVGYTSDLAINALNDNSLNVGKILYDNTVNNYQDSIRAVVYNQTPMPSILTKGDEEMVEAKPLIRGSKVDIYLTVDHDKVVSR